MSIFYKNQGFKQSGTSKDTLLTCPTDGTIIIKSIYCANNDASSAILVNMNFVDSSDSSTEYEFFRDDVAAKSQVNASPQGLNLEAGDAMVYKGCERPHWREPMPGLLETSIKKFKGDKDFLLYYHQIFFHYVLQDGLRADKAWDKNNTLPMLWPSRL